MSKRVLMLLVLATGCSARPRVVASPQQRTDALVLYMQGASSREVASQLAMQHEEAQYLLHTTIKELHRKYYRQR